VRVDPALLSEIVDAELSELGMTGGLHAVTRTAAERARILSEADRWLRMWGRDGLVDVVLISLKNPPRKRCGAATAVNKLAKLLKRDGQAWAIRVPPTA
jgi:hypothetical protein